MTKKTAARPNLKSSVSVFICLTLMAIAAQARVECGAVKSQLLKVRVRYCAYLPASYDAASDSTHRYPILYFLHGLGDNEQSLMNSGELNIVENLSQEHKITDFLVVTPQAEASFYVNSRDGRVRYGDFFLREFLPFIERKYRVLPGRDARGISGISMGGYGALRIAFANPELFSSVSAHSAALVASPRLLNSALNSSSGLARVLVHAFGNPVDMPFWQANSPFALARRNAASLHKMRIYFDCGKEDDYGFEEGARLLHEQLQGENIKHEFHLYPGSHSLPYFLAHFPQSLQFHSEAFKHTATP